jgi:hypothetical protein
MTTFLETVGLWTYSIQSERGSVALLGIGVTGMKPYTTINQIAGIFAHGTERKFLAERRK